MPSGGSLTQRNLIMFSRALKGTSKKKTTMNWWEYWIGHCWMTGWQSIGMSFRNWRDLMTGNYKGYALMFYDDPYEECYSCFWSYLGDDDVLPKEFLESLMQMADDVKSGKVKTYPLTEDLFDRMKDLVGDLIDE
jgi:hypothetical protein